MLRPVHMDEKIRQITWFSGKESRFGTQISRNRELFFAHVYGA